MAAVARPPPWGVAEDPPDLTSLGGNQPSWMLRSDEMGQNLVLVMQVKRDENDIDSAALPNVLNRTGTRLPHAFIVGKSIEAVIGVEAARAMQSIREARGLRYLLRTNSHTTYQKLQQLEMLADGTNVEVFPHPTLNSVQGIVFEPDTIDLDEKTILEFLTPQGVKAVRRISRRVGSRRQNTPLIVLTFQGTKLPPHVYFGLLKVETRMYYPAPMLCYNCGNYGHTKKACSNDKICLHCSQIHEMVDDIPCANEAHCKNCQGSHSAFSKTCPIYVEEDKIMRYRVDQNISLGEARKIFRDQKAQQTYANVVQQRLVEQSTEKDQIIQMLREQLEAVRAELNSLKEKLQEQLQNNQVQPPAKSKRKKPEEKSPSSTQNTKHSTPAATTSFTMTNEYPNTRQSRKDLTTTSNGKKEHKNTTETPNEHSNDRNRSRSNRRDGVELRSKDKKALSGRVVSGVAVKK